YAKKSLPFVLVSERYKSDSIEHDLSLVDIRHHFSTKKRISRYYSENQIQSYLIFDENNKLNLFKKLHFDALAIGKNRFDETEVYCLQFENNQKRKSEYQRILTDYYSEDSLDYILY